MSYVELHANSAFSFLRGASFPEQLAQVAAELEMPALGLLDRTGFMVRSDFPWRRVSKKFAQSSERN